MKVTSLKRQRNRLHISEAMEEIGLLEIKKLVRVLIYQVSLTSFQVNLTRLYTLMVQQRVQEYSKKLRHYSQLLQVGLRE